MKDLTEVWAIILDLLLVENIVYNLSAHEHIK